MPTLLSETHTLSKPLTFLSTVEQAFIDNRDKRNTVILKNNVGDTNGKLLQLRVAGTITTDASVNITLKLYHESPASYGRTDPVTNFGIDTLLRAYNAVAVNSTTASFIICSDFVWDSTSQKIAGHCRANVLNTTSDLNQNWTNTPTSVASPAGIKFFLTVTASGSSNGACRITEFVIEQP